LGTATSDPAPATLAVAPAPASPQILAVDDRHRHGVEIEIIQQQ
jgi:hypothetical protein